MYCNTPKFVKSRNRYFWAISVRTVPVSDFTWKMKVVGNEFRSNLVSSFDLSDVAVKLFLWTEIKLEAKRNLPRTNRILICISAFKPSSRDCLIPSLQTPLFIHKLITSFIIVNPRRRCSWMPWLLLHANQLFIAIPSPPIVYCVYLTFFHLFKIQGIDCHECPRIPMPI